MLSKELRFGPGAPHHNSLEEVGRRTRIVRKILADAGIRKEEIMSWNLSNPEIKSVTAATAKELLAGNVSVPQSIKDYVIAGIDGLAARHGDDVRVTVTGHGHLCDVPNKDSYDVTTATIEVRKT